MTFVTPARYGEPTRGDIRQSDVWQLLFLAASRDAAYRENVDGGRTAG